MDDSVTDKYCGMCCQTLPIDSFHLRSAYVNGRQSNCKECRRNASASKSKPAKLSTDEVMIRFTEKDFYRFLCNFEATDDCWMWRGNLRGGYGYFCVTLDKAQYVMKAHRASYYLFNGEVGDLFVCHRCDTPACVNPAHLFLGTNQDNILDASVKGRLYKGGAYTPWKRALTHCKRGHPLSGDNLSAYRKRRVCLACMRLKGDESRERKRRAKAIQQEAREA